MAYRPKDTQERVLHRLKITKGHLEKVIKMVEDDVYCIDVIHQMQAVEAAVRENRRRNFRKSSFRLAPPTQSEMGEKKKRWRSNERF